MTDNRDNNDDQDEDNMKMSVEEMMTNGIVVDDVMNPKDGSLPFAYFNPESEGRVHWTCAKDQEGRIVSVMQFDAPDGTYDRKSTIVSSEAEAIQAREALIQHGWKKLKSPEITFTTPGQRNPQPLNRKQKRYLKKQMQKMNTTNPFTQTALERRNN